jgi:proline dehydrogenase
MQWFRRPILSIAGRPTVERFTRSNRFIKSRLVDRFVAGESLDETLPKVLDIYRQGMTVTLDELGENVHSEAEARAAVGTYQESLRRLADHGLEPNISIKLTMLGLDLGEKIARDNLTAILETARSVSGFVRIDMEGSAYVEQTMALFKVIHDAFRNTSASSFRRTFTGPAPISRR